MIQGDGAKIREQIASSVKNSSGEPLITVDDIVLSVSINITIMCSVYIYPTMDMTGETGSIDIILCSHLNFSLIIIISILQSSLLRYVYFHYHHRAIIIIIIQLSSLSP